LTKTSHSNVWVADFETESVAYYEKYGHTKTWLTYIENLDNEDYHMGISIHDHYKFIIKQLNRQKVSQFVYFHNVSFDGTFLLYFLNEIGVHYETVINDMKRIYEIKVYPSKAKRHISFRCTYLIFMCAVASLPHSTKSTIDYDLIRNYKTLEDVPDNEKHYIKQDVLTVKRNLLDVQNKFGIKLTGFFKTIASISYKDLRYTTEKMLRERNRSWLWFFPKLSIELDHYIRGGYRGGITYLNPKFKGQLITEEVGSWDEVSEYPSVMVYENIPAGKPYISNSKPKNDRLYMVRIRVLEAKIKEGLHPFINPNKTLRYLNDIYPNELNEVVLTLTNIDYELYEKYYNSVHDVLDYCVFPRKIKGAFNNYIFKYYEMKKESKETIKRLKKLDSLTSDQEEELKAAIFNKFWAKLKLNSTYGKFGTNPLLCSATPVFVEGLLTWESTEEMKEENVYYLPAACFITAYARRNLINQIQANNERFIYCDTDSLHLLGTETPKSLKGLIGSKLGQWEYEGTSYKSKFIKPKQYLKYKYNKEGELEIKRTIASLNRSEHYRINFENFESGVCIEAGKKVSRNVKGGRIIKPLDFTFK
jgi:hypothetical protein